MNLPNLVELRLISPPKSTSINDSTLFFNRLNTPRLENLQLQSLNPKDPSSMKVDSVPRALFLDGLQDIETTDGKTSASAMTHSIQDWKGLRYINFRLPKITPSNFYEYLFQLLTPLSGPSIQSGWRDKVLLPELQPIRLRTSTDPTPSTPIDGLALASMVASRNACSKGLSFREVVSCGSGLLESLDATASNEPAFESTQSCHQIGSVKSDLPVKANGTVISWLERNCRRFRVKEWVYLD